ncbi:somatostatin receptor type 5-like [Dreissena polymorpha]|uniref:somatostatin receptor type 5-like n=1 Tax=Dreissena polymorpha TaxID=45954 RepID=UPI0022643530|nr:somatostatin receptor type 5-like [Dreissena polymorpha]
MTCASENRLEQSGVYPTIIGISWFAANMHISMIAVVRYMLLLHPLKSKLILTKSRVMTASFVIWTVGLVFWITYLMLAKYGLVASQVTSDTPFVVWAAVYLLPVCITVFMHLRKWFVLLSVSKTLRGQTVQITSRKISKLILVIIIFPVMLPIPKLVFEKMTKYNITFPSLESKIHFEGLALMIFFINSSINPVLYAFLSLRYRQSIRRACDRLGEMTSSKLGLYQCQANTQILMRMAALVWLVQRQK